MLLIFIVVAGTFGVHHVMFTAASYTPGIHKTLKRHNASVRNSDPISREMGNFEQPGLDQYLDPKQTKLSLNSICMNIFLRKIAENKRRINITGVQLGCKFFIQSSHKNLNYFDINWLKISDINICLLFRKLEILLQKCRRYLQHYSHRFSKTEHLPVDSNLVCNLKVLLNICSKLKLYKLKCCQSVRKVPDHNLSSIHIAKYSPQRKLLSYAKRASRFIIESNLARDYDTDEHENHFGNSAIIKSVLDAEDDKTNMTDLEELMQHLRRDISKDPRWAMLSVTCLLLIMVVAIKVCGMRPINKRRQINVDINDDFHNVSVLEVIHMKRLYLPKEFLRFKRKLKKKIKKKNICLKEKDIADPLSDNSEDEKLIYSRVYDF